MPNVCTPLYMYYMTRWIHTHRDWLVIQDTGTGMPHDESSTDIDLFSISVHMVWCTHTHDESSSDTRMMRHARES